MIGCLITLSPGSANCQRANCQITSEINYVQCQPLQACTASNHPFLLQQSAVCLSVCLVRPADRRTLYLSFGGWISLGGELNSWCLQAWWNGQSLQAYRVLFMVVYCTHAASFAEPSVRIRDGTSHLGGRAFSV